MAEPRRVARQWLDRPLRRLYGNAWDAAPTALSGAVAVVVLSAVLVVVLTLLSLLFSAEPRRVLAIVVALVAVIVLLEIALAALLLRGSRLVWMVFVAFHASALALTPDAPWEVPSYVLSAVVLVLLLAPSTWRTVWRHRPSPYAATYQDVRRPD